MSLGVKLGHTGPGSTEKAGRKKLGDGMGSPA